MGRAERRGKRGWENGEGLGGEIRRGWRRGRRGWEKWALDAEPGFDKNLVLKRVCLQLHSARLKEGTEERERGRGEEVVILISSRTPVHSLFVLFENSRENL